jgi:hypothetical protein
MTYSDLVLQSILGKHCKHPMMQLLQFFPSNFTSSEFLNKEDTGSDQIAKAKNGVVFIDEAYDLDHTSALNLPGGGCYNWFLI